MFCMHWLASYRHAYFVSQHVHIDTYHVIVIVVGFFRESFSGLEQGPGHAVQVGYQKGAQVASQNLVFNVMSIPGTAGKIYA